MTRKIFLSIVSISFIAVIMAIVVTTAVNSRFNTEKAASALGSECRMLAAGTELGGTEYLSAVEPGNVLVEWLSAEGEVLYSSGLKLDDDILVHTEELSDGTQLRVSCEHPEPGRQLLITLQPTSVALAFLVLFALAAAILISRHIVRPINEIDLDRPKANKSYKELAPLLEKLRNQNHRIYRQMEELRRSRRQFSLITESMSEGIVVADPRSTVLTCNSSACRLLGTQAKPDGQSIFTMSQSEQFRRCIQDALGGRKSDCIISTPSGDRKVIASPASISDEVNGIVAFVMDVTEERKLETMRREFTSNVSHELKTPLTTIYGIADMLANGMVRPEDVTTFGGDIRSEADRLMTLIGDIVSLSKLDENFVPAEDEEVDLYELSAEIVERLSKNAAEKNVTAAVTGDHVKIIGCRTVLDEVIMNLCDNAIKYNVSGGKYSVHISHIPMKALITVRDTGIGIPDEHIDRIFERFYRADKSRSRKVKGTGLGLSIVKHGVAYHGGTVRAASYDSGTVFTVELPMSRTEEVRNESDEL